jgi:isopenicillin N synthase-like dioxygenase
MPALALPAGAAPAIPTLRLGEALHSGSPHAHEVAQMLGWACESFGAVYVTDHGIDDDLLLASFAATRALFDAAPQDDGLVRRVASAAEDEVLELFECTTLRLQPAPAGPRLPGCPPAQAPLLQPYAQALWGLSRRLMQLLALSLDLPRRAFEPADDDAAVAALRLLRYLPCADGGAVAGAVGARAHTDRGALTVLAQDHHDGLEMQRDDGSWLPLPPREGALLVHAGDVLAQLSGGRYRAPLHRVRRRSLPQEPRLSVLFFYSPLPL